MNSLWNASITLENAIGEASVEKEVSVERDEEGNAMVVEEMRVSGVFFEFMELNHFPFDSQVFWSLLLTQLITSYVKLSKMTY